MIVYEGRIPKALESVKSCETCCNLYFGNRCSLPCNPEKGYPLWKERSCETCGNNASKVLGKVGCIKFDGIKCAGGLFVKREGVSTWRSWIPKKQEKNSDEKKMDEMNEDLPSTRCECCDVRGEYVITASGHSFCQACYNLCGGKEVIEKEKAKQFCLHCGETNLLLDANYCSNCGMERNLPVKQPPEKEQRTRRKMTDYYKKGLILNILVINCMIAGCYVGFLIFSFDRVLGIMVEVAFGILLAMFLFLLIAVLKNIDFSDIHRTSLKERFNNWLDNRTDVRLKKWKQIACGLEIERDELQLEKDALNRHVSSMQERVDDLLLKEDAAKLEKEKAIKDLIKDRDANYVSIKQRLYFNIQECHPRAFSPRDTYKSKIVDIVA